MWSTFLEASERAEALVESFTGLVPAAATNEPRVVGRGAWVDANLVAFRELSSTLASKLSSPPAVGRAASTLLAVQLGGVLGWVSQRVLGQYDLFSGTGQLLYVGPNVIEFERRFGLDPSAFRLWVALHEVTHRVQFSAVPWLHDHVRGLLDGAITRIEVDAGALQRGLGRVLEVASAGPRAWRDTNLIDLVTTPEQRAMLTEIRALMSVIEGHASYVMNGAGVGVVPGLERMREAAAHRREAAAGGALPRALGITWKLQQYADGERFLEAVEAEAGRDAVNIVWRSPQDLPTFDELRDATGWLARVGG